ncbi:MAG: anti-sigma factor family protein [Chloroherpetonaceae bacterium]
MTYDDYRYELPDFILGKSSPSVAKEIERLIESDAAFRAEYLEMKSLIEETTPALNRAFEAPSQAYFETLSERVLARVAPKKTTWWEVLKSDLASLVEVPRWQWAGGVVGVALALVLIIFVAELDDSMRQNKLAKSNTQIEEQTVTLIATSHFAMGITPETIVSQVEVHEAEEVLSMLESRVPTRKQTYKVLTEDEVESLFKSL